MDRCPELSSSQCSNASSLPDVPEWFTTLEGDTARCEFIYFKMPGEHKCENHGMQQLRGCIETWWTDDGERRVRRCYWDVGEDDACRVVRHDSLYPDLMDAVEAYLSGRMVAVRLDCVHSFCQLVHNDDLSMKRSSIPSSQDGIKVRLLVQSGSPSAPTSVDVNSRGVWRDVSDEKGVQENIRGVGESLLKDYDLGEVVAGVIGHFVRAQGDVKYSVSMYRRFMASFEFYKAFQEFVARSAHEKQVTLVKGFLYPSVSIVGSRSIQKTYLDPMAVDTETKRDDCMTV